MSEQLTPPALPLSTPATVREDLVNTAVKFLENPNVVKTSLAEQQRFLQRKGLTDEEIRVACERSGAYTRQEQLLRIEPQLTAPTLPHSGYQGQLSLFDRVKSIVHNVAVFSFVAYIIYKFYEKYIMPFFYGKKKTIEDSIQELDKNLNDSVSNLKGDLDSVKVEMSKISNNAESNMQKQLVDLKSEMATVKCLLLSRNQFPAVKSSVVRPSIPEWQKTSISHDSDNDSDPDRKTGDFVEIGSGSGSSEHENNTHKSDSSLDIISFSSQGSDFRRKSKEDIEKEND